jgi:hypothetical protein
MDIWGAGLCSLTGMDISDWMKTACCPAWPLIALEIEVSLSAPALCLVL